MLSRLRSFFTVVLGPIARLLLRMGVSPDAVTVVGTLGVMAAALVMFPMGMLFPGTMVITFFVFSDLVDGIMARTAGRSGPWGAFLDSTLDRFADAAIFVGLLVHLERVGDRWGASFALAALVLGSIVPYARARAEGLGMTAQVGIAERADRLVAALVAAGLVGLGVTAVLLDVVLGLLAVASAITVVQRMATVHRQATSGPRADG
jgi:CDP-diacylglycerol--glycerol-3-phosphate 3-phosphatidyltransferase